MVADKASLVVLCVLLVSSLIQAAPTATADDVVSNYLLPSCAL